MTIESIRKKIESIQDVNYNRYVGSNEEQLATREEIIKIIEQYGKEQYNQAIKDIATSYWIMDLLWDVKEGRVHPGKAYTEITKKAKKK